MKTIAVLFLVAGSACAQKVPRPEFLASKVPEAAQMCHEEIINGSKDPESVKFLADYTVGSSLRFGDNIEIDWDIMGRNSFGAVLRHHMVCLVVCKQDKRGCKIQFVSEK